MTEQLLALLEAHANRKGLVLSTEKQLVQELGTGRDVLAGGLKALEVDGTLDILSPLPFLVVKLKKWSGKSTRAADSGASAYSYAKLFQSQQMKESYRQEPEHPSGSSSKDLLQEVLETLGETDAAAFRRAVELYAPHIVRTALDRVRRTRGIRKSRTALFRHLLPRLAREAE